VDGVPVLVQDHLGVLGVVDAALPVPDLVLRMIRLERVVLAPLIDADVLRLLVHRRPGRAEAEALDVLLGLRDPVVRHHLLELVLVPRVDERVRRRVRGIAGLADDVRPVAAEIAAPVEVRQRHRVVLGRRHRRIGVLLVGERLVPARLNRIRDEDLRGSRRRRGRRLRGRDRRDQHERQQGRRRAKPETLQRVLLPLGPTRIGKGRRN